MLLETLLNELEGQPPAVPPPRPFQPQKPQRRRQPKAGKPPAQKPPEQPQQALNVFELAIAQRLQQRVLPVLLQVYGEIEKMKQSQGENSTGEQLYTLHHGIHGRQDADTSGDTKKGKTFKNWI